MQRLKKEVNEIIFDMFSRIFFTNFFRTDESGIAPGGGGGGGKESGGRRWQEHVSGLIGVSGGGGKESGGRRWQEH